MGRIKLNIFGLSVSQAQTGAYAMVLKEEDGDRRIPIIIGQQEAQAIALSLEGITAPRPLTHDTFAQLCDAFKLILRRVEIYKMEAGIFYAQMFFIKIDDENMEEVAIESRTSDAIAMALHFPTCPIYTTEEVMSKAAISFDEEQNKEEKSELETRSDGQLQAMLDAAIENEDYERASVIHAEINKRKNKED